MKNIVKSILKHFVEQDDYLEYLTKSTRLKWEPLGNNTYLCRTKTCYLIVEGDNVRYTRQSYSVQYQDPMGPFCTWSIVNKYSVHNVVSFNRS